MNWWDGGGWGGRGGGVGSSVVRGSGLKSEDPGFDTLVEQGRLSISCFCPSVSTLVQTCMYVPDPHLPEFD